MPKIKTQSKAERLAAEQLAKYRAAMGIDDAPVAPAEPPLLDIGWQAPKAQVYDGTVEIEAELLCDPKKNLAVFPEIGEVLRDIRRHFPGAKVVEIRVPAEQASRTRRVLSGE